MAHFDATPQMPRLDYWLSEVRGQFQEMPGLRLTLPQARRLFGLDDVTSAALLAALVDATFLRVTPDGHYMRAEG